MSELEQEQVPDTAPEVAPDEQPDEQPTPLEAPDEDEEAHESDEIEGHEREPEQPEAQALSQKDMEDRWKRIGKSAEVFRKRIPEVFEGDAEMFVPCPLCEPLVPGYVMIAPDTQERFPSVREFMGDAQPVEWQQDPNTRTCQTCSGYGMVNTGSRVEGQERLPCTDCGGKGWQGSRAPVATSGPMAPALVAEANGPVATAPQTPDPPDVAELKRKGYTIIAPVGS